MITEHDLPASPIRIRVVHCLWKADIQTLQELNSWSDESLLSIPEFGRKCLEYLRPASKAPKYRLAQYDSLSDELRARGEIEAANAIDRLSGRRMRIPPK